MSLLLVEGPEKAGKSTLIRLIKDLEPGVVVRKWYQPRSYGEYYDALQQDLELPLVIWDRGWPSDAVYSKLMPTTPRRFQANADWAEDRLGKPLHGRGLKVILLGPDPETLLKRRTEDDLPVNPRLEQLTYLWYARRYNYLTFREGGPTVANALLDLMEQLNVGNAMWPMPRH